MNHARDDRRTATRQVLRTNAKLLFSQGLVLDARTLNIRATGMAIVTDGPIALGTAFALRCHLLVNRARSELVVPVRVVHSVFSNSEGGFVVGLTFSDPSPEATALITATLTVR